ncbi:MAG TPA: 5-oxoprolinase subunit PxpB [Candidatus Polarisedimenticolia bacterium]|nr:5-oxoprolinase subunit PxpB [Candidatus Polarisedimenticolia bacterium]
MSRASDRSLLVSFGARISMDNHGRVRSLLRLLDLSPLAGIVDLIPAYGSILIRFDPLCLDHAKVEGHVRSLLARGDEAAPAEPGIVEIPVCYGGRFGPDLDEVAQIRALAPQRVVELHAAPVYRVYFLGFVPGFAYLGDLPEPIVCPRLPSPRRAVPKGSVGIAGAQTGIYPIDTPGGWRLIGRTPLVMFDPRRDPMSRLEIGDRVRFAPISQEQFKALEEECRRSSS